MRQLILVVGILTASDPATRALLDSGHYKQARAILEPRVKANPNDAEAAALLARVRLEFGDFDGAVQLAETATKLDGGNAAYHHILAEAVGRSAQRASIFKQLGMAKRYRAEEDTALRLDPKSIDAREGLLPYYLNAPSIAGGDRKKADQMADEIASIVSRAEDAESRSGEAGRETVDRARSEARCRYTGLAIVHAFGHHGAELDEAVRLKPDLDDAKKDLKRLRTS